ncbi:hypothetical protein FOL47_008699 [Perkinsus chesapeaki]|uniref:Uncharacterized protein n=1 Tax=Perkinsus chesapeaki TaxID=330153 RepID=A0A7J6LCS7_PERCH|nr:hypothetical protein FOL47_008699 [Perkinsus chesapeaki]
MSSSSSGRWDLSSWTDPRAFWKCLDFLQGRKPPLPEDVQESVELNLRRVSERFHEEDIATPNRDGEKDNDQSHAQRRSVRSTREKEIVPIADRPKVKPADDDLFDEIKVDYEQPLTLKEVEHERSKPDPKLAHEAVQSMLEDPSELIDGGRQQATAAAWETTVDDFEFDPVPTTKQS